MQIVTVQFNYEDRSDYKKLLDVFEYSCKKNMPKAVFNSIRIDAPVNNTDRALNFKYNTVKLRIWTEFLEKTKDKHVILADCDMLSLRPAGYAFKKDFDVAYTERTRISRIPMNGGILFVKVNRRSINFFKEWLRINIKMFKDKEFHQKYRRKYAGMNQAAFGYMYQHKRGLCKLHRFYTKEFNAVDCDWPTVDKKTVFLHTKSTLRKLVLGEKKMIPKYKRYKHCIDLWNKYYREMERSK